MTNTTFNGWKNKETWLVNVWFGDYVAELGPITPETYENTVEEIIGQSLELDGLIRDLFNCSWNEIDWRELAGHTTED